MATVEEARAAARAARAKREAQELQDLATATALEAAGCGPAFANGVLRSLPPGAVAKPQTDAREYLFFELRNGLRVMVAQDPDASALAAAALVVQAGTVHEPKDIPGLAHFCEHMVLHGTTSLYHYSESTFADYLKQHGGSHNAATTTQQTCFAFEVAPDYLEGALHRFSRFFASPYFDRGCGKKEVAAVESEHSMNLQNDFRRQWAILLLDANPEHPYHWGSGCQRSLETDLLERKVNLHRALEDFHASAYTAERMALAVVGTQSLPDLAGMALRCFAGVPRGKGPPPLIGDALGGSAPPFLPQAFHGQVFVAPVKELRQLRLAWLLPWQVARWRTKPAAYVTYLLGHEGRGGVMAALRARGLASACTASCCDYHGAASTLEVTVDLADGALDAASLREVGEILFAYIALLRAEGPQRRVFQEQQQLQELQFRFSYDVTAYSLVQDLASNLHYHPPEEALAADQLLYDFDPDAIVEVLGAMQVSGARLWLVAREFAARCTSEEPWYGGHFLKLPELDSGLREPWVEVENSGWRSLVQSHGLHLPRANKFVPADLSLRTAPAWAARSKQPQDLETEVPWVRAWFRGGAFLEQPKAAASIFFHCPFAASSSDSAALTLLICRYVQEELNEDCAFEARVAGVMYKLEPADTGFILQLLGFSDRLGVLASAIAEKIAAVIQGAELSENVFAAVRDRIERLLSDALHGGQPYAQASAALEELLCRPRPRRAELLRTVKAASGRSLAVAAGHLLEGCCVEALLVGNLSELEAQALLDSVLRPLLGLRDEGRDGSAGGGGPGVVPARAEAELPRKPALTVLALEAANPADVNSCALQSVCCMAEATPENEAVVDVLLSVAKPMFFNELRTKQQLGYFVSSFARTRAAFISLAFVVQTERHEPEEVRERIDDFLSYLWRYVSEEMTEEEFSNHRDGVAKGLQEEARNIWDVLVRDWAPIEDRSLAFDARERQLALLRSLTLAEFRRFAAQRAREAPRVAVLVRRGAAAEGCLGGATGGGAHLLHSQAAIDNFRANLDWREIDTAFGPARSGASFGKTPPHQKVPCASNAAATDSSASCASQAKRAQGQVPEESDEEKECKVQ